MTAYYNEIDPKAAAWLRELIKRGHIAKGEVDERTILDVRPDDLSGFTQCHFFAGIGVWSYALRRARWPDDRPVWTGSCPCQPFSAAGKGDEFADERHLWPAWFRLIRERRPVAVFGEQVASKDALSWLDHVSTDLEAEGYAVGAADTCAAGFGAPHIRQRLYFVADSCDQGLPRSGGEPQSEGAQQQFGDGDGENRLANAKRGSAERHGHEVGSAAGGMQGAPRRQRVRDDARNGVESGELADSNETGPSVERSEGLPSDRNTSRGNVADRCGKSGSAVGNSGGPRREGYGPEAVHGGGDSAGPISGADGPGAIGVALGDAIIEGPQGHAGHGNDRDEPGRIGADAARSTAEAGPANGFWSNAEWIACRDGKARPTEPGTFPLVTGAPARVVRLRGYGNAINAEQARNFIEAYQEVRAA